MKSSTSSNYDLFNTPLDRKHSICNSTYVQTCRGRAAFTETTSYCSFRLAMGFDL